MQRLLGCGSVSRARQASDTYTLAPFGRVVVLSPPSRARAMVQVADDSTEPKAKGRVLIDASAGAIAGCIARFFTGPLDVIKIRFQVQLEPITRQAGQLGAEQGLKSKYTGFGQAFATILKEEGVQFVALQQVRQVAASHGLTAHPTWGHVVSFASGAAAGAAGTIASYPFDLLRTTMAAQGEPKVYRSVWDAARSIVSQRGVQGLYSGLGVTLVEIVPYAALQFGLYDTLNGLVNEARERAASGARASTSDPAAERSREEGDGDGNGTASDRQQQQQQSSKASAKSQETKLQHFACGLIAGLVAKLVSHPLDVAKKRYQVAGLQRSLRYGARVDAGFAMRSLADSLLAIYKVEGIAGLWKGSIPSIIKAAPSAAITFTAYDAVLTWLLLITAQQQQQQHQHQR